MLWEEISRESEVTIERQYNTQISNLGDGFSVSHAVCEIPKVNVICKQEIFGNLYVK
jgi:hypothetical protein